MTATDLSLIPADDLILTHDEMRLFQDLMYREAGIRLADAKINLVQSRLRKRLDALSLDSYHKYYAYATSPGHEPEFQLCLESLTTNETFFFRHKLHWDFLLGNILPAWRDKSPSGATFKAWSAASSSGEEPYSLAIALASGIDGHGFHSHIEATDINTQVLARAKAGIYAGYALQKLTPRCLKNYFSPLDSGQCHQVKDVIRKMVSFRPHNLKHPSTGPAFDLILVRNVLIYFDGPSKATVLAHLARRLKPGGWLILGGAESLTDHAGEFEMVRPTIYRKR